MDDIDVTEPLTTPRRESPGDRESRASNFDPLFIANSDHPGMQLVANQFTGYNFLSWSRSIRMALGAKMKLGFINGGCKKPDADSDDYQRWIRCDFMVMSWIVNSMKSDIAENFMYVQSAQELWEEIRERFAESNAPLIYQFHRELSTIRQDNSSVVVYYSKLKKIWDELQALEGYPICRCGVMSRCSCVILKKLLEKEAIAHLMQFLMGLSDGFDTVRSNILSMDPLPSVNKAYHMVMQIERQKEITGGSSSFSHEALTAGKHAGSSSSQNRTGGEYKRDSKKAKTDKLCDFCHEKGHVKDTCFKLIGYPDWFKGPRVKGDGTKFAGNTQEVPALDNPFDFEMINGKDTSERADVKPDSVLVNAVFNEVVRMMKGKMKMDDSSSAGGLGSVNFANFAGHFN